MNRSAAIIMHSNTVSERAAPPVNKAAVAAAFGRAAQSYDAVAHLQQQTGAHLRALIAQQCALPGGSAVLDAGCGTGWFSGQWQADGHRVTALDLSAAMLQQVQTLQRAARCVQGDIEQMPCEDNQFALCFSNLAVQWCDNLSTALAEMCRVTRPGGIVAFSTLSAGSLSELSQAFAAVDDARHANGFLPPEAIAVACQPYRHTLSAATYRLMFPSLTALLHSLKGIGATRVHEGRAAGLMTRHRLAQLAAAWPAENGEYPLSYHIQSGVIHVEK